MSRKSHEAIKATRSSRRGKPRKNARWVIRLKPLPEAEELAQVRKELREMTPEQFIQSLVDAGILTPGFRLTAPYRRLEKEGYVYAPKGMKPDMLPVVKQLSLKLQREARRGRREAAARRER